MGTNLSCFRNQHRTVFTFFLVHYSKALPLAFTEHGAVMAASVLNTPRAIEASIFVVRGFVEMRQIALKYTELADKIRQLEGIIEAHDEQFRIVFEAITQLIEEDEKPKKKIGYIKEGQTKYGKRCSLANNFRGFRNSVTASNKLNSKVLICLPPSPPGACDY